MRSDGTVLLMLADLIQYFSVHTLPENTRRQKQSNDVLREIIAYVNNHYKDSLTLDDMARQTGFSREYFCRFSNSIWESLFYVM